jgi:hypothetical protein
MKAILKYGCLITAGLGVVLVAVLIFLAAMSKPLPSTEEAIATLPESERAALARLCELAGIAPKDLRNINGHDDRLFEFPQNKHAVYIRGGHVVGLFLRDTPLSGVPDLSALSGLEVVRLPGCGLDAWPRLSGITTLRQVDLSNQPLGNAAPSDLPAGLQRLHIAGTQTTDLSPLAAAASLEELDASGTPVTSFDSLTRLKLDLLNLANTRVNVLPPAVPKSGEWKVNLDGTPVLYRPGYSASWPFDGWITTTPDGTNPPGGQIGSDRVEVSGTNAPVKKPRLVTMPRCTDPRVPPVWLEVSCQSGKVRVWMEEPPDYFTSPWMQEHKIDGFGAWRQRGFVSAVAEPGKPGKVYGRMRLDLRDRIYEMAPEHRSESRKPPDWCEYSFMVEPLDGSTVTGLAYRVTTTP